MGSLRVAIQGVAPSEEFLRWLRETDLEVVEMDGEGVTLDLGPDERRWDDGLLFLQEHLAQMAPAGPVDIVTYLSDAPDRSGRSGWRELEVGGRTIRLASLHAFGSGAHPTTLGCLTALDKVASLGGLAGAEVLDVGTGSGVLAIAARALGAPSVLALDIDPSSIQEARANVAANRMAGIELMIGGIEALSEKCRFGVVMANLVPAVMAGQIEGIIRCCRRDGFLILSGSKAAVPMPPDAATEIDR